MVWDSDHSLLYGKALLNRKTLTDFLLPLLKALFISPIMNDAFSLYIVSLSSFQFLNNYIMLLRLMRKTDEILFLFQFYITKPYQFSFITIYVRNYSNHLKSNAIFTCNGRIQIHKSTAFRIFLSVNCMVSSAPKKMSKPKSYDTPTELSITSLTNILFDKIPNRLPRSFMIIING